jgi:hypothetical protein
MSASRPADARDYRVDSDRTQNDFSFSTSSSFFFAGGWRGERVYAGEKYSMIGWQMGEAEFESADNPITPS